MSTAATVKRMDLGQAVERWIESRKPRTEAREGKRPQLSAGEAVRLTWEDVWQVDGHVEISVAKSKTRARRLVTINPSLAPWLEPCRPCSGPLWRRCLDHFHETFGTLLAELKIAPRRNGLRHGFVSAHHALHSDEGLTAKESGNSPAMVHKNYKGLLTRKQAEQWFAVAPAQAANAIPLPALSGKQAQ